MATLKETQTSRLQNKHNILFRPLQSKNRTVTTLKKINIVFSRSSQSQHNLKKCRYFDCQNKQSIHTFGEQIIVSTIFKKINIVFSRSSQSQHYPNKCRYFDDQNKQNIFSTPLLSNSRLSTFLKKTNIIFSQYYFFSAGRKEMQMLRLTKKQEKDIL